jgi:hypothetical protein
MHRLADRVRTDDEMNYLDALTEPFNPEVTGDVRIPTLHGEQTTPFSVHDEL